MFIYSQFIDPQNVALDSFIIHHCYSQCMLLLWVHESTHHGETSLSWSLRSGFEGIFLKIFEPKAWLTPDYTHHPQDDLQKQAKTF